MPRRPGKRRRAKVRQPSSIQKEHFPLKCEDPAVKARWDPKKTIRQNYQALGLKMNPNQPDFVAPDPVQLTVPPPAERQPARLSKMERAYVRNWIKKHGDNYKAMSRDLKNNPLQLTPKQLRKKCEMFLREGWSVDDCSKPPSSSSSSSSSAQSSKEK
ncbi:Nucleolar protein 16 [Balamuthia mandrillaris]